MFRGSVWWVDFEPSTGSEIKKVRPAVIVSNDHANDRLGRVVVVPVTGNTSRIYPGEAVITIGEKQNKAMTDQIMAADKSRLKNKVCVLSASDMQKIDNAIRIHLGL
jgi:mRNA interferase MazF